MPPAAMRRSVWTTISRAAWSPVRRWWRNRSSRVTGCGNFGAAPNPPCVGSYRLASARYVLSSTPGSAAPPEPAALACDSASTSRLPASTTAPRRSAYAPAEARRTWAKDGSPWRGSGGK